MAVITGGRVRTATGTAVIAALILVLAFGNPAYVDWGGHMFAGAVAGLIAAFIQVNADLLGAFTWASAGAVYALFVGWIIGLATFGARR